MLALLSHGPLYTQVLLYMHVTPLVCTKQRCKIALCMTVRMNARPNHNVLE
jgi:hypothetical protein